MALKEIGDAMSLIPRYIDSYRYALQTSSALTNSAGKAVKPAL